MENLTITYEQLRGITDKALLRLEELESAWNEMAPILSRLRTVVYTEYAPEKVTEDMPFSEFKNDAVTWLDKFIPQTVDVEVIDGQD